MHQDGIYHTHASMKKINATGSLWQECLVKFDLPQALNTTWLKYGWMRATEMNSNVFCSISYHVKTNKGYQTDL